MEKTIPAINTQSQKPSGPGWENFNIKEWEFEFRQRNASPIIMADFWCRGLGAYFQDEADLPVGNLDYLFTDTSRGYVKSIQRKNVLEVFRTFGSNENKVRHIMRKTMYRFNDLEVLSIKIERSIAKDKSIKNILSNWDAFNEQMMHVIPWFWFPWYLTEENIVSDHVMQLLSKHEEELETGNFDSLLALLVFPVKKANFQKEQESFFDLVKRASKQKSWKFDRKFLALAKKHIVRFAYLKTYFLAPIELLTLAELLGHIQKAQHDGSLEYYATQQEKQKQAMQLVQDMLRRLKNDEELVKFVDVARELGWALTMSVEVGCRATARLHPFYKLIAQKMGIVYEDWGCCTYQEIVDTLQGVKQVDHQEIKRRKEGFVYRIERGKILILSGEEGKRVSRWIEVSASDISEAISELHGKKATPGCVRGAVRVASKAEDVSDLKEGEILVCSMTSPDYVPVMKRAGAIVTDEGGILSHAAIISRELGKPCIVGTKIATQVLKDGDMVEVDADKGVVRIISKN